MMRPTLSRNLIIGVCSIIIIATIGGLSLFLTHPPGAPASTAANIASQTPLLTASSASTPPPPLSTTTISDPAKLPLQAPPVSSPLPGAMALPSVSIIDPAQNSVIPAGNVTISVKVTNFNGAGQFNGMIYYYLDVEAPTAAFKLASTAQGTFAASTSNNYTWSNVAPGAHTFSVELVNTAGTPIMPPLVDKISVSCY
jgi:hypothetical protein